MINERIKILIDVGLVREQFIHEADKATLVTAQVFADRYVRTRIDVAAIMAPRTIGALMIKHGVLTPELIENTIIANADHNTKRWHDSSDDIAANLANLFGTIASLELKRLIETKALGAAAVMSIMKEYNAPFENEEIVGKLSSVLTPGASNVINWGMTNIVEFEVARRSIVRNV